MAFQFALASSGGTLDPKRIVISTDGATWTTITRSTSIVDNTLTELPFRSMYYAGSFWFATTLADVNGRINWYSINLYDWYPCIRTTGANITSTLNDFSYHLDTYWALTGQDTWKSDDGINWERVPGVVSGPADKEGIAYGNLSVAVAADEGRYFTYTTDGINWTTEPTGLGGTFGGSSNIEYSHTGGFYTVWRKTSTIAGDSVEVSTTYDFGVTWTNTTIPNWENTRYASGVMPDGTVVITGFYDDPLGLGTNIVELAYSTDGINWAIESSPTGSDEIYYVNIAERPASDVILIANTFGETYGNSSIGQGNPWTLVDVKVDSGDTSTRINGIANSYPLVSADPYIIVGADVPIYTVEQYTIIQATLRYEAPVQTGQDSLMLYRVSKDYRYAKTGEVFPAMPQTDEGRPYYDDIYDPDDPLQTTFSTQPGILPYRYEIVEPWGQIAVFINGVDVTFFREAATVIENISWQTFGNFEAASFFLPAITFYDKLAETIPTTASGTGGGILPNAIQWLTDDAPIEIKRIRPDSTLETIWLGVVNGLDLDPSGVGMRITAHGLLYEANHQLLPGDFTEPNIIVPRDTGLLAAEVLNSISGEWSYAEPITTGIETIKSPNWDNALDFLRNLNSFGSPEIWIDTDYKPYVNGRPDIPADRRASTFDLIAGQDGIEMSLQYDATASPTVIYGTGSKHSGVQWRNVVYPAISGQTPFLYNYPFDTPEEKLSKGMSNTDTVTGFGVSALTLRLKAKGFISSQYFFTTYFDDTVETAVKTAQEYYGLDVTGELDGVLWSRLTDIADIFDGAYIAPLYTSPLIDPSDPSYDPSVRRVEQFIDFGANIDPDDAAVVAQQIVERDMIQYTVDAISPTIWKQRKSVTGTITLTMDPIEYVSGGDVSRWDLKPGDSIRIIPHIFAPIQDDTHDAEANTRWEAGDSGGSLLLYIKRIEWSFGDTPSAILTVSTRNLEYNELDAAQARVRVSNAERAIEQKAKKASGKTAGSQS